MYPLKSFSYFRSMKNWISVFFLLLIIACNKSAKNSYSYYREFIPSQIKDSIYSDLSNPPSAEKIKLGRYLFYDNRMSINNTKACASCHDPKFSFTDNYRRSIGAYGDLTQHNAAPLINIIFNRYFTATDTSLHFPEQQINNPMFRDHPVELGWKGNEEEMLKRFNSDTFYPQQFKHVFPDDKDPVSIKNIQKSITSFIKTIISLQSPYDDYYYRNNKNALNESAIKGMQLFQSPELKCSQCHGGINFNQPVFQTFPYMITGLSGDSAMLKVPTLRNLAFTAPYLHDGSAETIVDVIKLYEAGGSSNVNNKHQFIKGFKLNSQERRDLLSFLLSLSDSSVLINPAYANPFSEDETKKYQCP
jgi:cytochrome c peroxidase